MFNIYTDGSCRDNPGGPGGWAAIVISDEGSRSVHGGEDSTTSQRMELTAAIKGLEEIPHGENVTVYSDSRYLVNTMQGKWKRHTNQDLWQQLDDLKTVRSVFWEWVKGHAGHPLNEEADRLAVSAMRTRAEHVGETSNTRMDNDVVPPKLTHIDSMGNAAMVDISGKSITERIAIARGSVHMNLATLDLVLQGGVSKGDVFTVARIAGISAAKRTWDFIPLAHQIQLSHVDIQFEPRRDLGAVDITAVVKTNAGTGVEMEALTAVTITALTIYDMCKAIDRSISIRDVHLVKKSGGRTGEYERDSHSPDDKK